MFKSLALTAVLALSTVALADPTTIGLIELEDHIDARPKVLGLGGTPNSVTMRDVMAALQKVAADPIMKGVVIRLKDTPLTMAEVDELGAKIKSVRAAGKKVHLYAENYETKELMLGSYCDEIIAQSGGAVSLPGVYMEEMFLADTFKWVGITPDFVQIGDYKGASETMANAHPSKEWDQNINQLLDGLYAHSRNTLKSNRHLSDAKLDSAMNELFMAMAEDAQKAGLVDAVLDLPALDDHLAKAYGGEITWDDTLLPDYDAQAQKKMGNIFGLLGELAKSPVHEPKRDTIAILHIDGAIIDGESTEGGMLGGEAQVGSRTIRRALGEIEENDMIKGCIIRIDSPGGSAIASEVIWLGVKRVADKKPVWVSVGDMAASGGYYIAVSGQKIYVNPSSIVGSIGVVGGKLALGGAYEKLHVNVVQRARGPRAAMMAGSANPWSAEEKALVRTKMTETYQLFTSRVTAGRSGINLKETAEGRLFVGDKAVQMKMADKVGGLEDAEHDLAASLSLADGAYDVMDYPAPMGLGEVIGKMLKGFGADAPRVTGRAPGAEIAALAKAALGDRPYAALAQSMDAMLQLRKEPVILTSPRVLIFK